LEESVKIFRAALNPRCLNPLAHRPDDMTNVSVGDIWNVNGSEKLGVIIFLRSNSANASDDLRVVPIYKGAAIGGVATHRDLIVPATENSLKTELLAAAWNARRIEIADLTSRLGTVTPSAVEAIRKAELIGIIPGIELPEWPGWQGPKFEDDEAAAAASDFQLGELRAWDALEDTLSAFRNHDVQIFEQYAYKTANLLKGRPVMSEILVSPSPVFFVPISNLDTGNLAAPAFLNYAFADDSGALTWTFASVDPPVPEAAEDDVARAA
jgi:hypothetical protein